VAGEKSSGEGYISEARIMGLVIEFGVYGFEG